MKKCVFLDTGVLGVVTHPAGSAESRACVAWLLNLLRASVRVCVPEICDYELRREYVRRGSSDALDALAKLDELNAKVDYVPIGTAAMRRAAELWADARNRHRPRAAKHALDGDMILCAQALLGRMADEDLVVATTNVADLTDYVAATQWQSIVP